MLSAVATAPLAFAHFTRDPMPSDFLKASLIGYPRGVMLFLHGSAGHVLETWGNARSAGIRAMWMQVAQTCGERWRKIQFSLWLGVGRLYGHWL